MYHSGLPTPRLFIHKAKNTDRQAYISSHPQIATLVKTSSLSPGPTVAGRSVRDITLVLITELVFVLVPDRICLPPAPFPPPPSPKQSPAMDLRQRPQYSFCRLAISSSLAEMESWPAEKALPVGKERCKCLLWLWPRRLISWLGCLP